MFWHVSFCARENGLLKYYRFLSGNILGFDSFFLKSLRQIYPLAALGVSFHYRILFQKQLPLKKLPQIISLIIYFLLLLRLKERKNCFSISYQIVVAQGI